MYMGYVVRRYLMRGGGGLSALRARFARAPRAKLRFAFY